MKRYLLFLILLTGPVFFSCSEDDDTEEEPVVEPTGDLIVKDQVYENRIVTIDHAEISHDGWLAIYDYPDQRGELLGYTFIEAGEHEDIEIELEESAQVANGETLLALLHLDADQNQIFDWLNESGVDLPLKIGANEVSQQFKVMFTGESWITVLDQSLTSGPMTDIISIINLNLEQIQELLESETARLVAYDDRDGGPGEEVGMTDALTLTSHYNVPVYIYGHVAVGEKIWLVLHNEGESAVGSRVWDPEKKEFLMTSITIEQ